MPFHDVRVGDAVLGLLVWLLPVGILVAVSARNWNRGTQAPPRPTPGSQWAPDPTGRHQLRLWDGRQWTAHISDHGVSGWDPLP